MCTIGVTRLASDDYLIFKNKDFPRSSFEDAIVLESEVFGISGASTWSDPDPAADLFSGMSVGANATGLLCADANVGGPAGLSNYDELVETALRAGGGLAEGVVAIKAAVAVRLYMWGNIIMIDSGAAAAVEVRGNEVAVTPLTRPTARSNHHLLLGTGRDAAGSPTTEQRLFAAQDRIDAAASVDDILALQRAHDSGETGICSHVESQAVYSYVLRQRGGESRLDVTKGHPCLADEADELIVPLGERWSENAASTFRDRYPSARVSATS